MARRTLTALVKELMRSALLLLLVTMAMFAILNMAPGDPVALFVNVQNLSPEELADVRHELGLDRSLPARYGTWLARIVCLDLGTSLRSGRKVTIELWRTGWRTLLLAGSAMLLTLIYATLTATLSALGRRPQTAAFLNAVGYILSGLPVFWLCYLAIYIATKRFNVFPVMMGADDPRTWTYFWIPVVVLGLGNGTVAEVTRHLRNHLSTVLSEDYIRTARAKGANLFKHLYKDGFVMPLTSLLANKIPYVLGGAIVVEQIFNWPGMGQLTWQAANERDYPVLLGVTLVSAMFVRVTHVIKGALQVAVNPQLAE
ncbi:MAG: ABC transporter permease [Vicinamibacteria bacterium]|jgi:peptide/nickel transport system permease protein|nr:ABC transporter permease [Vicinamibacteria bacterium]